MQSTTTLSENNHPKIPFGKLMFGLVLIVVGVALFFETIDLWDIGPFWHYWPLVPILIGLSGEIDAIRQRRSDGSYLLLAAGVWMLFGTFEIFDLSYFESMPVGIVVAGLFVMLHAIIDAPEKEKEKEKDHGSEQ